MKAIHGNRTEMIQKLLTRISSYEAMRVKHTNQDPSIEWIDNELKLIRAKLAEVMNHIECPLCVAVR